MKTPFSSFWSVLFLVGLLLMGCSKDEDPPAPQQNNNPVATKVKLSIIAPQSAQHSDTIDSPYEVLVTDQFGDPYQGAIVKFLPQQGSVINVNSTTDAAGKASATWILGPTLGWQTMRISAFAEDGVTPLEGSPITVAISAKATNLKVGDLHEGGVIFYLDFLAEHGYVVALSDQDSAAPWCNSTAPTTGADGTALGTGMQNTLDLVANCGAGTAAAICDGLTLDGYDDWFLPSKDELLAIYQNRVKINPTLVSNGGEEYKSAKYWASSEFDVGMGDKGYALDYSTGSTLGVVKTDSLRVRAIRAF